MTGAHPNEVKAVMRHSTITLTMDTYGHRFPSSEAETVKRFSAMMDDGPTVLRSTGTADSDPQQLRHETVQKDATMASSAQHGRIDIRT